MVVAVAVLVQRFVVVVGGELPEEFIHFRYKTITEWAQCPSLFE